MTTPILMAGCVALWAGTAYHNRCPAWVNVTGTNSVIGDQNTQAAIDGDIAAAAACGLDCFDFTFCMGLKDYFAPGVGGAAFAGYGDADFNKLVNCDIPLFRSSTIKSRMKYTLRVYGGSELPVENDKTSWTTYVQPYIVAAMAESEYLKVTISGVSRPYLHIWDPTAFVADFNGNSTDAAAAITALRSAVISAGMNTPFIVGIMNNSNSSLITTLGLDAGTIWGTVLPNAASAATRRWCPSPVWGLTIAR